MSDELRISIEKLVYGGDGLAHADGNTVFVPYVLPGEQVRATAKSKRKKLVWAKLLEVTSASAQREGARCPHFQTCGGCHYQHIPAAEQLRLKKEILLETLSRLGGIQWAGAIHEHSAEPYGYRNRAQWAVRNANPRAIGYFLPESSVIVPIDECPVLSPLLAKTFGQLQELARSNRLPEKALEIEAFVDSTDSKLALNVAFERFPKPPAELAATFREALPELESLLLADESKDKFELTGPGFLFHEAAGFRYRVSHLSFFQVNRFLVEDLLQTVVAGAKGEAALDLYAGVNVISHNEHAEEFLGKTGEKPDFVVLDPPRSGLGAEAAAKLAALGAAEIAYLSCDPSTLARDLAVLTGSKTNPESASTATRYEIADVHLFDLFPQTYHIETLVRLRRAP